MKKRFKIGVMIIIILLAAVILCNRSKEVRITILQTADIHGMLYPYNYEKNSAVNYGMAHIASVVKAERVLDRELLLIDTGDIARGNSVENYRSVLPHPTVSALNFLDYDVWTLGNHEFNFEFSLLENQINNFSGYTVSGNIYTADGKRWQKAWQIFNIKGVRVAIFGITAPHIPYWEGKSIEHYNQMSFTEPVDEAGVILSQLEGRADVIIGNIHYGLGGSYGSRGAASVISEYSDKIDALFLAHSHQTVVAEIEGVPVLQPDCKGRYVSRLSLTLRKNGDGWAVQKQKTEAQLIDVSNYPADADFLEEFSELHQQISKNK